MRMTLLHYVCSARRVRAGDVQECRFLYAACRPRELLWVDSKGTDGKPTFRRLANLSWLSEICHHFGDTAAWSPKSLKTVAQNLPFWKKNPLRANFQICFWKENKQNFGSISRSRYSVDRVQNLSGPAPYNILGLPQISSKSVHFRRSYSRTREHRWNVPQSVSNTQRSFFAE